PMLEIAGLDHIEQHQHAARILGAARRIGDGPLAFGRIVNDRQEFPAMAGFAAEAFRYHGKPVGRERSNFAQFATRPEGLQGSYVFRAGNIASSPSRSSDAAQSG